MRRRNLRAAMIGLQRAHKQGFRRGLFVGFVLGVLLSSMMGCLP